MKMTVHPAQENKANIFDRVARAVWFDDVLWDLYRKSGQDSVTEFVTINFENLLDHLPALKAEYLLATNA